MQSPFVEAGQGGHDLRRLLEISEATAAEYTNDPRVEAIILVGSVARGPVDRVSDIDMMLYLNEYFSEEEVAAEQDRARSSGGGIYGTDPKDGFGVWRCVDGVKVDLGFNMIPNMEELISEVLDNHTLNNDMHLIVDGIRRSRILYGQERIDPWLRRIDDFPPELGSKMIRERLSVSPLWVARDMCAGRGERIWLQELMLEYLRRGLWVLCGLNGRYFPGKMKGFERTISTLDIAPEGYVRRAQSLFEADPDRAIEILRDLMLDIYDLVDRHRPEIDTAPARNRFLADVVCTGKK